MKRRLALWLQSITYQRHRRLYTYQRYDGALMDLDRCVCGDCGRGFWVENAPGDPPSHCPYCDQEFQTVRPATFEEMVSDL